MGLLLTILNANWKSLKITSLSTPLKSKWESMIYPLPQIHVQEPTKKQKKKPKQKTQMPQLFNHRNLVLFCSWI